MSKLRRIGYALGSLSVLTALGVGAYYYYYYRKRRQSLEILKSKGNKKILLRALDEIILESAQTYFNYASIFQEVLNKHYEHKEQRESALLIIQQQFVTKLLKTQENIVKEFKITKKYFEELRKAYKDDEDIQAKEKIIESAFKNVINGQAPDLHLNIPETFTKEMYLTVLKRLFLMNLNLYYIQIQADKSAEKELTEEHLHDLVDNLERARILKRDQLFEAFNIPLNPGETYTDTMLKVLYTHKQDQAFGKKADELMDQYKKLLNDVFAGNNIQCLEGDPSYYSNTQISSLWDDLNKVMKSEILEA